MIKAHHHSLSRCCCRQFSNGVRISPFDVQCASPLSPGRGKSHLPCPLGKWLPSWILVKALCSQVPGRVGYPIPGDPGRHPGIQPHQGFPCWVWTPCRLSVLLSLQKVSVFLGPCSRFWHPSWTWFTGVMRRRGQCRSSPVCSTTCSPTCATTGVLSSLCPPPCPQVEKWVVVAFPAQPSTLTLFSSHPMLVPTMPPASELALSCWALWAVTPTRSEPGRKKSWSYSWTLLSSRWTRVVHSKKGCLHKNVLWILQGRRCSG